jgi:hypothetical protein
MAKVELAGPSVHVAAFAVDLVLTNPPSILAAINAPLALTSPTFGHKQPPLAVNGLSIKRGKGREIGVNSGFYLQIEAKKEWT